MSKCYPCSIPIHREMVKPLMVDNCNTFTSRNCLRFPFFRIVFNEPILIKYKEIISKFLSHIKSTWLKVLIYYTFTKFSKSWHIPFKANYHLYVTSTEKQTVLIHTNLFCEDVNTIRHFTSTLVVTSHKINVCAATYLCPAHSVAPRQFNQLNAKDADVTSLTKCWWNAVYMCVQCSKHYWTHRIEFTTN